jgi:hypothetical protein
MTPYARQPTATYPQRVSSLPANRLLRSGSLDSAGDDYERIETEPKLPVPPQANSSFIHKTENGFSFSTRNIDLELSSDLWECETDGEFGNALQLLKEEQDTLQRIVSDLPQLFGNALKTMARSQRVESYSREIENKRADLEDMCHVSMFMKSPIIDQVVVITSD